MCGASLAAFRRSQSQLSLSGVLGAHDGLSGAVLKSTKSYSDLNNLLPHGLSSLRIEERDTSTQSGSDDTGRSSPTEHLLRSRSPCAVLYSGAPASPPAEGLCRAPAAHPLAVSPPHCDLLPVDTPFLESAANFSVVQVPLAAGRSAAAAEPAAGAAEAAGATAFLRTSGSCSLSSREMADTADPVAAAAAATQNAFYSAASSPPSAFSTVPSSPSGAVAAGPPPLPPSAIGIGLPPMSPQQQQPAHQAQQPAQQQAQHLHTPFARLAMQEHPSVITPLTVGTLPSGGLSCSRQSSMALQPPSMLGGCCGQSDLGSSTGSSPTAGGHSHSGSISAEVALARRSSLDGWGNSTHLSEGHAAEELFYRLNHARQTVDFVKRQATAFSQLNKASMGVWEALELLNTLREYETALLGTGEDSVQGGGGASSAGASSACQLSPDMPLLEHALQCAEACRAAFPDEDFMHLAGLLAPLGKLLAHAKFGAEPQWAICGETFPVGCRFHPAVRHSQYFSANPDRRKRLYSSPTGVYREGCGLGGVLMSWGAGEYLHLVLRLNRAALPPEALFCIRHLKLRCVFRCGSPYSDLLSEFDRVQLQRLAKFQQLCAYRRQPRAEPLLVPVPGTEGTALGEGEQPPMQVAPALRQYYDRLIAKYIPQGTLRW